MFSLEGKTVLITGANDGIGFHIAKGAAQMGDLLKARVSRLRAFGGTDDRFSANLVTTIVIYNVTYLITTLPALAIRIAELRSVVGDAAPFGHFPWPGL